MKRTASVALLIALAPVGTLPAQAPNPMLGADISFLASPAASYVTGQTLLVCGGLSLGF